MANEIKAAFIGGVFLIVATVITVLYSRKNGSTPEIKPAKTEIYGVVKNSSTHEYVRNAYVSIIGQSKAYRTGDDGAFNISLNDSCNDHTYTLRIVADGYRQYEQQVTPPTSVDEIPLTPQ